MIEVSKQFMFFLFLVAVLVLLKPISNELSNMTNAVDDEYERKPFNWFALLISVAILLFLAGVNDSGPLAGIFTVKH